MSTSKDQQNLKIRIYAFFQFFTFVGIILIVFGMMSFLVNASKFNVTINTAFWVKTVENVLSFTISDVVGVFSSLLVYVGIVFLLITYPVGLTIFIINDRNLFDRVFLLFLFIPIFSNIFCFFSQLHVRGTKYTKEKPTQKEINSEKTQVVKLFKKNEEALNEKLTQIMNTKNINTKKTKVKKNDKKNK